MVISQRHTVRRWSIPPLNINTDILVCTRSYSALASQIALPHAQSTYAPGAVGEVTERTHACARQPSAVCGQHRTAPAPARTRGRPACIWRSPPALGKYGPFGRTHQIRSRADAPRALALAGDNQPRRGLCGCAQAELLPFPSTDSSASHPQQRGSEGVGRGALAPTHRERRGFWSQVTSPRARSADREPGMSAARTGPP
ncbi:hypothetical protein AcW1_004234 [Taiwanofungus camphoratus]|nr:hypothetical protein AcW1_004234 [Antrodia cinnamomea]